MQDLADDGIVENLPINGYWRYIGEDNPENQEMWSPPASLEDVKNTGLPRFETLHKSGSGNGCIYAYYFPAYWKEHAPFPIKIGMSQGDFTARIADQLGTSHPELPVIYRIHHTETPRLLEMYLHSALTLQGRHIDDAPGSEWFRISPSEFDTLLKNIELL